MAKGARHLGRAVVALLAVCLSGCASRSPMVTPTQDTSAPVNVTVSLVGDEETVYDWSTDRCAADMLPDLPVRAFRDAQGMVQLNVSSPRNFRLIGPDFDSLATDCQVTLDSANDPDPSHYQFKEWVGSTYTLDGRTVYALIHNEWYGEQASRWDASRDFSDVQGTGGWYYQGLVGSTYQDMTFDSGHGRWQGSRGLCQVAPSIAHPDLGCAAVRTWVSPVDATVTVSGTARDADPGGGNGVVVTILKSEQALWSASIDNGDTQGRAFSLQVPVRVGDQLHFRVDARGDATFDSTAFSSKIDTGPPPCPSGAHSDCLMMGVTSAVSTDGGRTFARAASADHLVAALPYRWTPDAGQLAMWQPSNIVKNPNDDYYYALVQLDRRMRDQPGFQGMCVMRTKTLDNARSWRAWDGTGFNLPFVDPYAETVDDPETQTCTAVSNDVVGALSYSLTYSSFLGRFVAVGHDIFKNPPGFYYSQSDDLIHWTPKKLLMAADLVQTTNGRAPYLAYPSLIDHDSAARNFDVIGQSPYLYFTRVNGMDPMDFDLLRIRITFSG